MKMKKQLAVALSTFGVAALALGGSTFAWFQVANTANLGLAGTTVAVGDNLQVGFRFTDAALAVTDFATNAAGVGLVANTNNSITDYDNVYWAANNITPAVMAFVTSIEGYSSNVVNPVTSGSFAAGTTNISLKKTPVYDANRTNKEVAINTAADKTEYVAFEMVFRVSSPSDGIVQSELVDPTAKEYKVFFDSNTGVTSIGSTESAFRLGVKNKTLATPTSKIINPNAAVTTPGTNLAGTSTKVGGRLDLNGDGVWDFTAGVATEGQVPVLNSEGSEIGSESVIEFKKYEIAYGEFTATPTWNEDAVAGGSYVAVPFSNQNFLAGNSHKEVHAITDITPLTAEYDVVKTNQNGQSGAVPLGTTNGGVLELGFQFWLEGWDANAVNSIAETAFGLYLSFIAVEA